MKKFHATHFALIISFIYAIAGSIVSVVRFWQYDVFYFDFGLFDKAIWEVSRFSLPVIDHLALGERLIFADHFSPTIFLLAPIFWIFPQGETLLIVQAIIVAASGFVLFLLARDILKNAFYAISLMLVYFLFVGLQNAVITDFHEVTIATLPFMLTFYSIFKKKKILYFISLILLLGSKETMFLLGIGIAIATFFLQPSWRKIAYITAALSIIWGLLAIKVVIPFFSGGRYFYENAISADPMKLVNAFMYPEIKRHTLFYTFFSFGFLPLLSPAFWFLIFQDFLVRFYPENFGTRWSLALHYSALIAAIMAVSSIFSLRFLSRFLNKKYVTAIVLLLLLNSLFLYRVTLDGPFALSYNPAFYSHTKDFEYLKPLYTKIPKDATVVAQNNIATHFTHQKVYMLVTGTDNNPTKWGDYIIIDNRPGQSPNNYWAIKNMDALITNLKHNTQYKIIYNKDTLFIFKKS